MARVIWSGQLSFGLVNVPVGLYSATQQQDVSFHQFEKGTNKRVRNKRVAENTDREVEYSDIVKGYEVSSGDYVMLTQEELDSVEPEKSRSIEISDFVELEQIDPIYYEKTYYLGPRDESAQQAYSLLYNAMRDAELAGVGSFVMRGKEYLAVIRPGENVLVLETLFFADEVREPEETLDQVPDTKTPKERELKTAIDLIRQLTTEWKPENYHDTYRERLLEMIRQKAKGEQIEIREPEPREGENVVDLMSVLQRSIEQAKGGDRRSAKKRGTKKGTAKKAASKDTGTKKAGSKKSSAKKSGTKKSGTTGGSAARRGSKAGSGTGRSSRTRKAS